MDVQAKGPMYARMGRCRGSVFGIVMLVLGRYRMFVYLDP